MKILVDTNILISAFFFPQSKPARALVYTMKYYEVFLCEKNVEEFREVLKRKAPDTLKSAEMFLTGLTYKLIPSVYRVEKYIRDVKDQPILNAAIAAGMDIIITGDKDFLSLELQRPKCMSAADFLEKFNNVVDIPQI